MRLEAVLERLSERGAVTVGALAAELAVSPATIRRDLERLEAQRLLSRIHGGAVSRNGMLYELPLRYRAEQHKDDKRRIAAAAAAHLSDDVHSVGLTGGTTTTEIARTFGDRSLTVVTNALNIASELAVRPNLKLVVTGGVARPESYELVGPLAEAALEGLNLDVVFVGVDGVTASAVTTHHEVEAHTNRRLIARARRVVVVCDSSKVGRAAFAQICGTDQVHELITDSAADPTVLAALRAEGVEVVTV
jgi:DeoR family transcriptional regulator of aga operon